jgi:uncharacterized membrane protein
MTSSLKENTETMANLVAIVYPDETTAAKAMETVQKLSKEYLIGLDDTCYVIKDAQGKVHLHQAVSTTGTGAAGGAFWGLLIGILFFVPVLGLALGLGLGALMGKFSDFGIDDKFIKEVSTELQPGNSALFVMFRQATADKAVPELAQYGGKVLRTTLSNESEAKLQEALAKGGETPSAS